MTDFELFDVQILKSTELAVVFFSEFFSLVVMALFD